MIWVWERKIYEIIDFLESPLNACISWYFYEKYREH